MRLDAPVRRLIGLACGFSAAVLTVATGTAQAATGWQVAHPPFTVQSNVPYAPLASVTATSASNAWAVGRDDGSPLFEHWDGARWTSVALPPSACDIFENSCLFTSVSADSASDVIAVGNAVLNSNSSAGWVASALAYRYNGSSWQALPVPSSVPSSALAHVKAFSPSDAWAIGSGSSGSQSVALATHWDGSSWTQVDTGFGTTLGLTMNAIAGSSGSDVWAGGIAQSSGYRNKVRHSVLLHYNGTSWSTPTVPDTGGILDLAVVSATNAWALGFDGSVLHWDGTSWTVSTKFNGGSALAAVSATDVWVAGIFVNSTLSLGHFDGSTWTTATAPTGIDTVTGGAALPGGAVWFSGSWYAPNGSTPPAVLQTTTG